MQWSACCMISAAGVVVDRNNDAGLPHPHVVLDLAGDTAGDVKLGFDGDARETDLHVGREPLEVVGQRPARPDGATERSRQFLDHPQVVATAQPAADRHDDLDLVDRDTAPLPASRLARRCARYRHVDRQPADLAHPGTVGLTRREPSQLHGGDRRPGLDHLPRNEATEARALDDQLSVAARQRRALAGTSDREPLSHAGGDLGAVGGRPDQQDLRSRPGQHLP